MLFRSVVSIRAGGRGLNLPAANHVFHFDRWWNPAVEQQATDRAYRFGQTKDVIVHNFTGEVAADLGVDWERVSKNNPRAIYLVISGFGPDEPDRRGYDLTAQALGGLMDITGAADGPPTKVGVAVSDLAAGLFAVSAVTSALYRREQTGVGAHLEVSLYEATLSLLINQAQNYLACGDVPHRAGNEHPNLAPYSVFATREGQVVIAVGTDAQFALLCSELGMPEFVRDERFMTNAARISHRVELRRAIEEQLVSAPAAVWEERFQSKGIPSAVVRSLPEALSAPEAHTVVTEIGRAHV